MRLLLKACIRPRQGQAANVIQTLAPSPHVQSRAYAGLFLVNYSPPKAWSQSLPDARSVLGGLASFAAVAAGFQLGMDSGLLMARRLQREPEPFEAEFNEEEFEDGEFDDFDDILDEFDEMSEDELNELFGEDEFEGDDDEDGLVPSNAAKQQAK